MGVIARLLVLLPLLWVMGGAACSQKSRWLALPAEIQPRYQQTKNRTASIKECGAEYKNSERFENFEQICHP